MKLSQLNFQDDQSYPQDIWKDQQFLRHLQINQKGSKSLERIILDTYDVSGKIR